MQPHVQAEKLNNSNSAAQEGVTCELIMKLSYFLKWKLIIVISFVGDT